VRFPGNIQWKASGPREGPGRSAELQDVPEAGLFYIWDSGIRTSKDRKHLKDGHRVSFASLLSLVSFFYGSALPRFLYASSYKF
jgi:hypothetical protein